MAEQDGKLRIDRIGQGTGEVAVVVLAHPPANLWTAAMARDLGAALDRLGADDTVSALILRGEGRGFSAGAALETALTPDPGLAALCARIEGFGKPIIAALHGPVLGAGAALALAAHWRVAHEGAFLGLPEVALGLIPQGGAIGRLARLGGLEAALRLCLEARPIGAAEALALGLVDQVAEGILGQAALALAESAPGLRRISEALPRDLAQLPRLMARARAQAASPAAARAIDCVEAAGILPPEMAARLEATIMADLAESAEAAGLVHALQAERLALQPPPETAGVLPEVAVIGIQGADDFAAELSLQAVRAGVEVVLIDADRAALTGALATVVGALDAEVAAGRLTPEAREAAWGRMAAGQGEMPEGLDLVFGQDLVIGTAEGAGIGLTVAEGPGGVAELSLGPGARPEVAALAWALGRKLGWRVVTVGPGGAVELGLRLALEEAGIAPRVVAALAQGRIEGAEGRLALAALAAEGARMLEDGRLRRPADLDALAVLSGLMARSLGGPFHQADRRGLLLLRADLRKCTGAVFAVSPEIDRRIAEGARFGL